jgi:3-methyladenine DNA glycosylase AlkD
MASRWTASGVVADLDARLAVVPLRNTASVRTVRRALSRDLRDAPKQLVRGLAFALTARGLELDRFLAAELLAAHPAAMASLERADLRRLGRGMNSWGDVDIFACILAGPAWRANRLLDAEVRRWARSPDRWWRRAAVVSTVPLNSRARGGRGDALRTLQLCRDVLADPDPLVVKALSWALRELAKRDPGAVRRFLATHDALMPSLVRREVRAKLLTGRKTPPSGRHGGRQGGRHDALPLTKRPTLR